MHAFIYVCLQVRKLERGMGEGGRDRRGVGNAVAERARGMCEKTEKTAGAQMSCVTEDAMVDPVCCVFT